MILKGNQRGGARDLALHLMKEENEHVEVHQLRGFASDNLMGALNEAYAVSRGTRCKQFLFSVSFNPPPGQEVKTADFEAAVTAVEDRLGLAGQPRAIVFHEKEGRRHAHAVWSRIDTEEMKAVQLSFTHRKLQAVSRELFLEHGWKMPRGLANSQERDPRNFTLEEWQHAKRTGKDPRAIKEAIQNAWAISDSRAALAHALEERGYKLARGDRRGFIAVHHDGEIYSIPRYAGVKTRQVRDRLGDETALPGMAEVKGRIARDMLATMERFRGELDSQSETRRLDHERRRIILVERQRAERQSLKDCIEKRRAEESRTRQARFRKGLKGLWDRLRGEHKRIREQNEREAQSARIRDRMQADRLIFAHLEQRRAFQRGSFLLKQRHRGQKREIEKDMSRFAEMRKAALQAKRDEISRPRQQQKERKATRRRGPERGWEM